MHARTRHHCFYYALGEYIKHTFKQNIEQWQLFYLLGGPTFQARRTENPNIPLFELRGNRIKSHLFSDSTGIKLVTQTHVDEQDAVTYTNAILNQGRVQLVITNCFFLPYDGLNYMKNSDDHMVLILSSELSSGELMVTDVNYTGIIRSSDLTLARSKCSGNNFASLEMEGDCCTKLEQTIKDIWSLVERRTTVLATDLSLLHDFRENLVSFNRYRELFRKLAFQNLSRQLRHPHGLITSRMLMAEGLTFLNESLARAYGDIADKWTILANKFQKLSLGASDLPSALDLLDELVDMEQAAAQDTLLILNS